MTILFILHVFPTTQGEYCCLIFMEILLKITIWTCIKKKKNHFLIAMWLFCHNNNNTLLYWWSNIEIKIIYRWFGYLILFGTIFYILKRQAIPNIRFKNFPCTRLKHLKKKKKINVNKNSKISSLSCVCIFHKNRQKMRIHDEKNVQI